METIGVARSTHRIKFDRNVQVTEEVAEGYDGRPCIRHRTIAVEEVEQSIVVEIDWNTILQAMGPRACNAQNGTARDGPIKVRRWGKATILRTTKVGE